MKKVLLFVLAAGSMCLAAGCSTPAYSPNERHQQIARNWDNEGRQATDDWDNILMLRPMGHLSIWSLR